MVYLARMLFVLVSALFLVCGATDPRPCCMPSKFSGTLISLEGNLPLGSANASISDSYFYMDYDYDNGLEYIEVRGINVNSTRRTNKVYIYNNYPQGKQYIVQENGNCIVRPLAPNSQLPNCIPGHFKYGGSYEFGSERNSVTTRIFSGTMFEHVTFDFHVTARDCVPFVENHHGNSGKSIVLTNWIYSNMIWNHTKVGVFDLPSVCDHATPIPSSGKRDVSGVDVDFASIRNFRLQ